MWSSLWNYLGFKHEDGPYSISEGEDQDEEDEEDLLFIEQSMIKKTLIGKVTRIETDYYLLDDAYYWPKTLVPKINHGRMIKIGDRVSVQMEKREDGQEQFKIVNVQEVLGPEGEDAHGDWNDPEDRWGDEFQGASATESWLRLKGLEADAKDLLSQVGKIVSVSGNQVTLSMQDQSQMTCDWAKLGPEYRPEKGTKGLLHVMTHHFKCSRYLQIFQETYSASDSISSTPRRTWSP